MTYDRQLKPDLFADHDETAAAEEELSFGQVFACPPPTSDHPHPNEVEGCVHLYVERGRRPPGAL